MAINIPIISDFDGKGIDKAIKEFQQLETAGEKAQFAIKKAALPAAAALGALAIAGGAAAKAAMEDQASAAELARTLQQSTHATDAQVQATEDLISSMTLATGVADTDLRNALATLARGMGDTKTAQDNLNLALDISAATGKDLTTVSEALSKAYNGSTTALTKLDPTLRGVIKEGASFDEVGKRLAQTFGGAAANAAETSEGRFRRMSVAMSEAQESIGQALLPLIEKLLPALQSLATFVQNNTTVVVALGVAFGTIAGLIIAANAAMTAWKAITTITTVANTALAASFTAIQVASGLIVFTAIIAGLVLAYNKFEWFRDGVKAVFKAIGDAIGVWVDGVKMYINGVVEAFKFVFNKIAWYWNNTFGRLSFKIPGWVPGIGGLGFDVPNIPQLADGGIVTSPTLALIGEAGPEAVVPLDRMSTGGNNVTINVNGGDPNAVVQALRTYMRMNGSVPIRVGNAY